MHEMFAYFVVRFKKDKIKLYVLLLVDSSKLFRFSLLHVATIIAPSHACIPLVAGRPHFNLSQPASETDGNDLHPQFSGINFYIRPSLRAIKTEEIEEAKFFSLFNFK